MNRFAFSPTSFHGQLFDRVGSPVLHDDQQPRVMMLLRKSGDYVDLSMPDLARLCSYCDERLSNKLLTGAARQEINIQRHLAMQGAHRLHLRFGVPLPLAISHSTFEPAAPLTPAQQQAVSPVYNQLMQRVTAAGRFVAGLRHLSKPSPSQGPQ